jgi:hypothetical protein
LCGLTSNSRLRFIGRALGAPGCQLTLCSWELCWVHSCAMSLGFLEELPKYAHCGPQLPVK